MSHLHRVAVGFDVLKHKDGLHDRGGAARTTAQLDQNLPGFEDGAGALTPGADAGVGAVDSPSVGGTVSADTGGV
jgi:hypothetical protein